MSLIYLEGGGVFTLSILDLQTVIQLQYIIIIRPDRGFGPFTHSFAKATLLMSRIIPHVNSCSCVLDFTSHYTGFALLDLQQFSDRATAQGEFLFEKHWLDKLFRIRNTRNGARDLMTKPLQTISCQRNMDADTSAQ